MTPVDQEFLHDPETDVRGDCFRATIASLLDLPIKEVPHFLVDATLDDKIDAPIFHKRVNEFLNPMGLSFFSVANFDYENYFSWHRSVGGCDIYHEISDESPRFPGTYHSVVGKNGVIVHDPHPSKEGLLDTPNRTYGFIVKHCGVA
jgi:hypothetical protein